MTLTSMPQTNILQLKSILWFGETVFLLLSAVSTLVYNFWARIGAHLQGPRQKLKP
jgi:hypothetical protein